MNIQINAEHTPRAQICQAGGCKASTKQIALVEGQRLALCSSHQHPDIIRTLMQVRAQVAQQQASVGKIAVREAEESGICAAGGCRNSTSQSITAAGQTFLLCSVHQSTVIVDGLLSGDAR